ncbi:MAG: TlpA disulfide reductase family protein [Tepidisphaeraceae bacterium]
MKHRQTLAAVAAIVALSGVALAQEAAPATLKVGDAAPALQVGKWIKGEPVKAIEKDKMYVVEFWATWCGPCRATIPHLSEMQKKNPDIIFIGQDVWENDEADIEPFVTQMGDKMSYRVATDTKIGQDGEMAKTWMKAAGQNGIPTAFLVGKDSKIAWIGHPMELEAVLDKVKAGTYDPKAEAESAAKQADIQKRLSAAIKAKDVDAAIKASDEMIALKPDMADAVTAFQFNLLTRMGKPEQARAKAEKIATSSKDPQALNAVAWSLATKPSATPEELKLAHQAADKANEVTDQKEAVLLDTSARIYAVEKSWDKAVDIQTKAVALAEAGQMKDELQKTLDSYKKQELPSATN